MVEAEGTYFIYPSPVLGKGLKGLHYKIVIRTRWRLLENAFVQARLVVGLAPVSLASLDGLLVVAAPQTKF